ncbi:MAG: glycosyl hydrolase [Clostridia bacterium]|nr:glycosyl hydrolase [Clostridia bacterium]
MWKTALLSISAVAAIVLLATAAPTALASSGSSMASGASALRDSSGAPDAAGSGEHGIVSVGSGSYTTVLPKGHYGPPGEAFITENIVGAVPTNKWWSSAAWTVYSFPMYPHPLTAKCTPTGLELGFPVNALDWERDDEVDVLMEHRADLEVRGEGIEPDDARVDGYSDWAVDIRMAAGHKSMTATLAHGSPYAFFTFSGVRPAIRFGAAPEVWYGDASCQCLGITVNGNSYGLFAPAGSTWNGLGERELVCTPGHGADYFSVAILPDGSPKTLSYFSEHAYAFITDTAANWEYDEARSEVRTSFTVTTEAKEGANTHTIMALYPHQWRDNASLALLPMEYRSIRGKMRVIEGNAFSTCCRFTGVLPWLPTSGLGALELAGYVDEAAGEGEHIRLGLGSTKLNTYVVGKNLSRLANVLPIAEQVGNAEAKDGFLCAIERTLEDWFSVYSGKAENLFYYDGNVGALIGYNAGYGSNTELNDHHFHYGYYIYAAASAALRDPDWADQSRWGGMVMELIRDIANWDRTDLRYPFLRVFDPYAGHSWASGTSRYMWGNNQESSSEAINAWAALILWGEATGNRTVRDLGVCLYASEVAAAKEYWFNVHGDNFPPEFENVCCSIVWGGKIVHTTWWTDNPPEVLGINCLPITAASLYLGHDPDYILRNYGELAASRINTWHDIVYSYLAMADPDMALGLWKEGFTPEFGETRAHTFHWLHSLEAFGRPDAQVTADTALYAVFSKDGRRTYVAYNPADAERLVHFSDGAVLTVQARGMAVRTADLE